MLSPGELGKVRTYTEEKLPSIPVTAPLSSRERNAGNLGLTDALGPVPEGRSRRSLLQAPTSSQVPFAKRERPQQCGTKTFRTTAGEPRFPRSRTPDSTPDKRRCRRRDDLDTPVNIGGPGQNNAFAATTRPRVSRRGVWLLRRARLLDPLPSFPNNGGCEAARKKQHCGRLPLRCYRYTRLAGLAGSKAAQAAAATYRTLPSAKKKPSALTLSCRKRQRSAETPAARFSGRDPQRNTTTTGHHRTFASEHRTRFDVTPPPEGHIRRESLPRETAMSCPRISLLWHRYGFFLRVGEKRRLCLLGRQAGDCRVTSIHRRSNFPARHFLQVDAASLRRAGDDYVTRPGTANTPARIKTVPREGTFAFHTTERATLQAVPRAETLRRASSSSVDACGSTNRASSHQRRKNTAGPVPGGRRTLSPPGSLTSGDKRVLLSADEDAIGAPAKAVHAPRGAGQADAHTATGSRSRHGKAPAAGKRDAPAAPGQRRRRCRSAEDKEQQRGGVSRRPGEARTPAAAGPAEKGTLSPLRRQGGNPQVRSPSERPLFFFPPPAPKQPGPTQQENRPRTSPPPCARPFKRPPPRPPLSPATETLPVPFTGHTKGAHMLGPRTRRAPLSAPRSKPPLATAQDAPDTIRETRLRAVVRSTSAYPQEGELLISLMLEILVAARQVWWLPPTLGVLPF
ncbi:hypothetical protein HPB48_007431 [Haemaphysalis longicornis]|uniref:Uncharacterized protein n=1 Tax=Haemaphysalis longicornis TaxID=44386 RepID=A0A9J6G6S7_HAELO|nr:hypothetical protein HPB48_007431 [Haemaphysalis longicornis]